MKELIKATGQAAKDSKEKYSQLKNFFTENTSDPKTGMQMTIKHALAQSALVGSYCGFSSDFWADVMGEYLKDDEL